jgi:hypothetical protein
MLSLLSPKVRLWIIRRPRFVPRNRLLAGLNPEDDSENHIDRQDMVISEFIPLSRKAFFMAKRRGNPNWGKPEPIGPITPTITEFEQVVREYKLSPDQYLRSTRLREWARRNKNSKYIPEPLLEAWGFEIESTL